MNGVIWCIMEKIMVKFEANAAEVARLTCQLFDNACELVREVPSYTLRTNLTGRFWEKIEKVLSG